MPPTPLPSAPAPPAPAKEKRPVSISASAFAFSLATPAKQTALLPLKAGPAPGRLQETPTRAQALPPTRAQAQPRPSRPSEKRPGPEDAGPSRLPFATTPGPVRVAHTRVAPAIELTPKRPTTPLLRPLAHLVTPLPARAISPLDKSGTERGKRKLNDVLDESSPFRPRLDTAPRSGAVDGTESGDGKLLKGWRTLRGVSEIPSAYSLPEAVSGGKKDENEGLGVSPRRTKGIIKWTGRGQPPLSLQLSNLLSAQQSSLMLFYTSLHQILHPPARAATPARPRVGAPLHLAHPPIAAESPVGPSPLVHLRTAPIVLVDLSPVQGRNHGTPIFRGSVLRWPTHIKSEPYCDPRRQGGEAREVLVILQPVPNECPRVGVDPRAIGRKVGGNAVGIWDPWSVVESPSGTQDPPHRGPDDQGDKDMETRADASTCHREDEAEVGAWLQEDEPMLGPDEEIQVATKEMVVFATRYLVAESTSR